MIKIYKKSIKKLKRSYWKLKDQYGSRRAVMMGISFGLYKVFLMPLILLMKKTINKSKENRFIFETKPDFADNGRALHEYMIEKGYNNKYRIYWLVEEPKNFKRYYAKNVKFVRSIGKYHHSRTVRAYYYSLTSKYVLFTHAFRWIEKKTSNQVYVNLWHGCGYKASRRTEGNENVFDYCLVPGEVFIDTKSEFFDCPREKVIPIGYPRYDLYKRNNTNVDRYFAELGGNGRKNILWMPTFRQSKDLIYYDNPVPSIIGLQLINSILDMDKLEQMCKEADVNLIIKRHRIGSPIKNNGNESSNIFYLDNDDLDKMDVQLYEFISKSDALITDYSSVAIDYILLDKPMGFTLDDMKDYHKTRGFAFDDPLEYMPGEHMFNLEDLRKFLLDVAGGKDIHKEKRNNIIHKTHNPTESYSKRVLDFLNTTI